MFLKRNKVCNVICSCGQVFQIQFVGIYMLLYIYNAQYEVILHSFIVDCRYFFNFCLKKAMFEVLTSSGNLV